MAMAANTKTFPSAVPVTNKGIKYSEVILYVQLNEVATYPLQQEATTRSWLDRVLPRSVQETKPLGGLRTS
jgi:hypothetical protein